MRKRHREIQIIGEGEPPIYTDRARAILETRVPSSTTPVEITEDRINRVVRMVFKVEPRSLAPETSSLQKDSLS